MENIASRPFPDSCGDAEEEDEVCTDISIDLFQLFRAHGITPHLRDLYRVVMKMQLYKTV